MKNFARELFSRNTTRFLYKSGAEARKETAASARDAVKTREEAKKDADKVLDAVANLADSSGEAAKEAFNYTVTYTKEKGGAVSNWASNQVEKGWNRIVGVARTVDAYANPVDIAQTTGQALESYAMQGLNEARALAIPTAKGIRGALDDHEAGTNYLARQTVDAARSVVIPVAEGVAYGKEVYGVLKDKKGELDAAVKARREKAKQQAGNTVVETATEGTENGEVFEKPLKKSRNVRQSPDLNAPIVGRKKAGETIAFKAARMEHADGYTWVPLANDEGWVALVNENTGDIVI